MSSRASVPAVRVTGLKKTYRRAFSREKVYALLGVSLEIGQGEIFGLLGPNGAGKTTLVKILLGVVMPTAGEATLFGQTVRDGLARLRVGYLPENHRFPGYLTAAQMLDLYGEMSAVPTADRQRRIPELLELVNMTSWRDTKIHKYSKGMMQRVGLAQALMNDPDLIFLDEPTDGVDPIGRREIRDILSELKAEGKTIFLNSHLLSEVEQVCTRIAILNQGELIREGNVSELIASRQVYELQSTAIPQAYLQAHITLLSPLSPNGSEDPLPRYRISVGDRQELNALIDELRHAHVEIESIRPLRQSLEDFFIDVVQSER